ncbi:hypothetical protein ACOMHN_038469 [Nucella lapillus]
MRFSVLLVCLSACVTASAAIDFRHGSSVIGDVTLALPFVWSNEWLYPRVLFLPLYGGPGGEEQEDCAEVVRYVLETYIPEKTWDPDVIERAHRLGKPNSHNRNPRPIIAKFQRWGDAMRVMKDRAAREGMEKGGLRVAQDLTRRQAARLRDLRSEGKMGYFVNGKLRVKDQRDTVPSLVVRVLSLKPVAFVVSRVGNFHKSLVEVGDAASLLIGHIASTGQQGPAITLFHVHQVLLGLGLPHSHTVPRPSPSVTLFPVHLPHSHTVPCPSPSQSHCSTCIRCFWVWGSLKSHCSPSISLTVTLFPVHLPHSHTVPRLSPSQSHCSPSISLTATLFPVHPPHSHTVPRPSPSQSHCSPSISLTVTLFPVHLLHSHTVPRPSPSQSHCSPSISLTVTLFPVHLPHSHTVPLPSPSQPHCSPSISLSHTVPRPSPLQSHCSPSISLTATLFPVHLPQSHCSPSISLAVTLFPVQQVLLGLPPLVILLESSG